MRKLGILKLSANDIVTLTFSGAITFSGTPNVTNDGVSEGSELATGTAYTIKSDGMLALSVASGASISQLTIQTSKPVLDPPTLPCNMTLSGNTYNPLLTVSSPVEGVTYNVSLGGTASTSTAATYTHTFTSANTLTIYTSKEGWTNSAKRTLTVTVKQVGMILANSVATTSLGASTINYETGATPTAGQAINGTWAIPG